MIACSSAVDLNQGELADEFGHSTQLLDTAHRWEFVGKLDVQMGTLYVMWNSGENDGYAALLSDGVIELEGQWDAARQMLLLSNRAGMQLDVSTEVPDLVGVDPSRPSALKLAERLGATLTEHCEDYPNPIALVNDLLTIAGGAALRQAPSIDQGIRVLYDMKNYLDLVASLDDGGPLMMGASMLRALSDEILVSAAEHPAVDFLETHHDRIFVAIDPQCYQVASVDVVGPMVVLSTAEPWPRGRIASFERLADGVGDKAEQMLLDFCKAEGFGILVRIGRRAMLVREVLRQVNDTFILLIGEN